MSATRKLRFVRLKVDGTPPSKAAKQQLRSFQSYLRPQLIQSAVA
jgi:hypothetical protein